MTLSTRSRILAVAGLVTIATVLSVVSLVKGPLDPPWVIMGTVEELDDSGVTYLGDLKIFLVATEPSPIGLIGLSTHLPGEPVLFCASSGWFFSPFYGEQFDGRGVYAAGPASRGLDRVAVRVVGDIVYVDPTTVEMGPPRGEQTEEPASPSLDLGDTREVAPGIVEQVRR